MLLTHPLGDNQLQEALRVLAEQALNAIIIVQGITIVLAPTDLLILLAEPQELVQDPV